MDHEPQADNSQSRGMFWAMGAIFYSSLQPTDHPTYVQNALPYLQLATDPLMHLWPTTAAIIRKGTNRKHTRQVRSTNHEPY